MIGTGSVKVATKQFLYKIKLRSIIGSTALFCSSSSRYMKILVLTSIMLSPYTTLTSTFNFMTRGFNDLSLLFKDN